MDVSTLIGVIVLVVVVVPLGLMLYADSRGMFDEIGGGAFSLEQYKPPPPSAAAGAASRIEREQEIRQLVQARSNRRVGRGEPALDVDAEVERLLSLDPQADPDRPPNANTELREEVRQLVMARNRRRVSKGEPALDVEAEIDRQLRDAGGV